MGKADSIDGIEICGMWGWEAIGVTIGGTFMFVIFAIMLLDSIVILGNVLGNIFSLERIMVKNAEDTFDTDYDVPLSRLQRR